MKELVVLSGKGGTGKTSIVGSLAALADNKVMVDCDVDAADLHLLLKPQVEQEHEFRSGLVAAIDRDACTECGLCMEVCRFDAIHDYTVQPASCEGCGFCARACPVGAISTSEPLSGHWYVSGSKYGRLVHARLGIGEENSGKLVTTVRNEARRIAEKESCSLIISDGPPGIGCPVISSLSGASLALLMTEPTLSGMHDLERVVSVCRHFEVPAVVCINKFDINEENSKSIESFCRSENIEHLASLPYSNAVTRAMIAGVPVVEYDSEFGKIVAKLWESLLDRLSSTAA